MSMIISQNELDAKQISDSVKNFLIGFYISWLLKASNIKKEKGESPISIMMYAFSLVFRSRSMYMDMFGNDAVFFERHLLPFYKQRSRNLDPPYITACFKEWHEQNCTDRLWRKGKSPDRG